MPDSVTSFVALSPWLVTVVIVAKPVKWSYTKLLTAIVELSDLVTTPPFT